MFALIGADLIELVRTLHIRIHIIYRSTHNQLLVCTGFEPILRHQNVHLNRTKSEMVTVSGMGSFRFDHTR